MIVHQYYYDAEDTTLSEAVLSRVAIREVNNKLVKVYVRKDEVVEDDDFGDLDVVMLTKSLQPHHYQIELKRRPKILQVERIAI
jgi:hypothetical protein